jgi:hypothetical protein
MAGRSREPEVTKRGTRSVRRERTCLLWLRQDNRASQKQKIIRPNLTLCVDALTPSRAPIAPPAFTIARVCHPQLLRRPAPSLPIPSALELTSYRMDSRRFSQTLIISWRWCFAFSNAFSPLRFVSFTAVINFSSLFPFVEFSSYLSAFEENVGI